VYRALIIPTLLYSYETWVPLYATHERTWTYSATTSAPNFADPMVPSCLKHWGTQ
jgi:hypothetical protein